MFPLGYRITLKANSMDSVIDFTGSSDFVSHRESLL